MGILKTGATAIQQSHASGKEKKKIKKGVQRATTELNKGYGEATGYLNQYNEAGLNALNQLQNPTENFYASPDYEFRRSEGLRDTGNMFNMRGGGGNAQKGITDYASNLASSEFGNWFNRMFAQSNQGVNVAGNLAGMANQRGMDLASLQMGQGNALAGIERNRWTNINNAFQSGHEVAAELTGQYMGAMGGGMPSSGGKGGAKA